MNNMSLPGFWKIYLGPTCSCGFGLQPDIEEFSLHGRHFHILRECKRCGKKWTLVIELKRRNKK